MTATNTALATARLWWRDRSTRERAMIGGAALLTLALVLWVAVIAPVLGWRAGALARAERAAEDYRTIATLAAEIAAQAEPGTAPPSTPLRIAAPDLAQAMGLTMTRIRPEADGGLEIWFESVPAPALYEWLRRLQDDHGARITRATMTQGDGGTVAAQLTVTGAP